MLLKESCGNIRKKYNVNSESKSFTFYSTISRNPTHSTSFQRHFFSNQYTVMPEKEASLFYAHLHIFIQ